MSTGSTKLQYALKNLRLHWEETQQLWNDMVRQEFENKHLKPMEDQASATLHAMDKIQEILAKMKHDCS